MCGIVGYIGHRNAVPILVKGLEHLEYRGYDSAGIACLNLEKENLFIKKEKGKLSELKRELEKHPAYAQIGIGHTRWATHGEPSKLNAHPHVDDKSKIILVHNGIIENHSDLKRELQAKGHRFFSGTDTEVAVNLIASYYKKNNFVEAFRKAISRLQGFYAFVALDKSDPDTLYVFKRSNPLVIGLGKGENFVASDTPALLPFTSDVVFLEDDEYAVLTKDKVKIFSLATGRMIKRHSTRIKWNMAQAQKGGYPHFMLKEIYEQPTVLQEAFNRITNKEDVIRFENMTPRIENRLRKIRKVFMVSCGTAYHAGLTGCLWMEQNAGIPSEARVSSEFRYQKPIVTKNDLVILITQSGETADTLAALREAKTHGAMTLAVVNVLGSTIAREADYTIYTHAGPEIGVASTKAYTAQLVTLVFLSLYMARIKKTLSSRQIAGYLDSIRKLPKACSKALKQSTAIINCAKHQYRRHSFLYIGRGVNFPVALEGALKLKEISYAHAHGYAAGEMKHGPIALIDKNQPVICIAPHSKTRDKMLSNVEEIRARKGIVIAIGTENDKELKKISSYFIPVPKVDESLSAIIAVIPLQLFAYHVAVLNRRDVDQPRNLAKSVTVE
ncbi:MAG: glutamine--fructose-6-phosphate transaminase (isomerizing) [Candidatus Omnitrophica bacterium]|nr:glutamine--fructose-6-phosphate transaminase (isomerizing) [Candidatus Omnitrophota bacterium]